MLDLFAELFNGLDVVDDLLLTRLPFLHELTLLVLDAFVLLLLLLACLAQILELLSQLLQRLLLRQLHLLK